MFTPRRTIQRKRSPLSDLTTVELLWLEKRIENRVRFGRPVSEKVLDRNRRRPVVRSRQHLRFRPLDIQRFWDCPISRRHLARGETRTTLFDAAVGQAWRREPVATFRLAEGRTGSAIDRCRRGARHRSCRRGARLLAPRSQPIVGQRNTSTIHSIASPTPGSIGGGSRHECAVRDYFHDICSDGSSPFDDRRSATTLHMECIAQRSDRSLPSSTCVEVDGHGTRCGTATRSSRRIP